MHIEPFEFLSTPSARRATDRRGGRPGYFRISIHALREEGDTTLRTRTKPRRYFYPRPPRGGRRAFLSRKMSFYEFLSTPSARRATRPPTAVRLDIIDFYPRPPRGGRLEENKKATSNMLFLSTPSARRATPDQQAGIHVLQDFYPRPPRGGRPCESPILSAGSKFLSTPSARRATPPASR